MVISGGAPIARTVHPLPVGSSAQNAGAPIADHWQFWRRGELAAQGEALIGDTSASAFRLSAEYSSFMVA